MKVDATPADPDDATALPIASSPAAAFSATLVAWQRTHGRHALPWQQLEHEAAGERDAYPVWLAEIMLQQTQVAAVVPFYRRFLERFPDVHALADASPDDVMQHWSGLGYYSRARNLHTAARRVVGEFGGRFPDTVDALQTLPGIGRSTAGAIAAFAYGRKAAILDGNVKRVLARVFLVEGEPAGAAYDRRLWSLSVSLLPDRDIERYTQGLMDLGATICTPRNPTCLLCPFERSCGAHRDGRENELPLRSARKVVPRRRTTMLVVTRGGCVLLERRPPLGIWGGLWSVPEVAPDLGRAAWQTAASRYGEIASIDAMQGFVHAFTHFVLEADIARVRLTDRAEPVLAAWDDAMRWVAFDALPTIGLPKPVRTLLATLA